ncbi:MAG: hypothetical protein IKD69_14860, partial [Solobacterium sp.]|nr:hypothetical protein [Solobacterium sp.]
MDILEQLAAKARQRTEEKKKLVPFEEMRAATYAAAGNGFPFEEALGKEELSFICECKKASPSKGIIADDYDPCRIAKEYEKVGADAVSVLTEPAWFLGNDDHLRRIVRQVSIPVLRKDFTVDAYMIYEANRGMEEYWTALTACSLWRLLCIFSPGCSEVTTY